jgi:3-methyladenine DNA glycosylase AlkD
MISEELQEIQQILTTHAKKESSDFFRKMVPGNQKIYGVKTPMLNKIVKKYKHGSFTLAEQLWNSGALEEKIIAIKIIEKTGREDSQKLLELFQQFAKKIDNWAVCDGLGMQFLRSIVKTDPASIFRLAREYNQSKDPWQRRLSLVMVEWYTRDKKTHPEINRLIKNLEQDKEYYVKKAVVWIKKNFKKGK